MNTDLIRFVWWPWQRLPRPGAGARRRPPRRLVERRRWHDRPFDYYGMSLFK